MSETYSFIMVSVGFAVVIAVVTLVGLYMTVTSGKTDIHPSHTEAIQLLPSHVKDSKISL